MAGLETIALAVAHLERLQNDEDDPTDADPVATATEASVDATGSSTGKSEPSSKSDGVSAAGPKAAATTSSTTTLAQRASAVVPHARVVSADAAAAMLKGKSPPHHPQLYQKHPPHHGPLPSHQQQQQLMQQQQQMSNLPPHHQHHHHPHYIPPPHHPHSHPHQIYHYHHHHHHPLAAQQQQQQQQQQSSIVVATGVPSSQFTLQQQFHTHDPAAVAELVAQWDGSGSQQHSRADMTGVKVKDEGVNPSDPQQQPAALFGAPRPSNNNNSGSPNNFHQSRNTIALNLQLAAGEGGGGPVAILLNEITMVTDNLEDFFSLMGQLEQEAMMHIVEEEPTSASPPAAAVAVSAAAVSATAGDSTAAPIEPLPKLGNPPTKQPPSSSILQVPAPIPMPDESITLFQRNDVLLGRGGETNHHLGNIQYRQLVKACQPAYLAAKRRDKPRIAAAIVGVVRARSGRFLKKHSTDNSSWRDVGNVRAREKTSQALREGAPELRGTVEASRTQLLQEAVASSRAAQRMDDKEDGVTNNSITNIGLETACSTNAAAASATGNNSNYLVENITQDTVPATLPPPDHPTSSTVLMQGTALPADRQTALYSMGQQQQQRRASPPPTIVGDYHHHPHHSHPMKQQQQLAHYPHSHLHGHPNTVGPPPHLYYHPHHHHLAHHSQNIVYQHAPPSLLPADHYSQAGYGNKGNGKRPFGSTSISGSPSLAPSQPLKKRQDEATESNSKPNEVVTALPTSSSTATTTATGSIVLLPVAEEKKTTTTTSAVSATVSAENSEEEPAPTMIRTASPASSTSSSKGSGGEGGRGPRIKL